MQAVTDASFDHAAVTYDAGFTNSITGRAQRNRVWGLVKKELYGEKGLNILEVNCGTGEDALWLSAMGHKVTATDVSGPMIAEARAKAKKQVQHNMPEFKTCDFQQLSHMFRDRKFDVVFSDFAGLNCVDAEALGKIQHDIAGLLKPGGRFIAVLLGKKCISERLFFSLKGEKHKAGRRMQVSEAVLEGGAFQKTWCYTVSEIRSIFRDLQLSASRPVGLFLPPSYLEPLLARNRFVLPLLQAGEMLLGRFGLLSDHADHVYLCFRKK